MGLEEEQDEEEAQERYVEAFQGDLNDDQTAHLFYLQILVWLLASFPKRANLQFNTKLTFKDSE